MKITDTRPWLPRGERLNAATLLPAVAVLALPVLLYRVGDREVSGIVEERVAITSREMWRSGEWVLPTMNGAPRLQKPPLGYWLPQLTAIVRGRFDDLTLRLPFATLAVGSLLLTCGAGCLLLGSTGGLLTAIVLLTTPLFAKSAHTASPDGALLFCAVGTWFFHVLARRHGQGEGASPRRASWSRIGFYVLLGLGALAKGPVILALTVLPILLEAAVTRSKDPVRALWSPVGIVLFLVLALSWPALVARRLSADSTSMTPVELWVLESVGKVLPGAGVEEGYRYSRHHEPWYYYVARLVPAFGVWSLSLPLVVRRTFRLTRGKRPEVDERGREAPAAIALRTALIWFASVLLFFSCVSEKKTPYMLPLIPLGAFIIAAVCIDLDSSRLRRGLQLVAGAGAFLSCVGVLLLSVLAAFPNLFTPLSRLVGERVDDVLALLVERHAGSAIALGCLACAGFLMAKVLAARHAPVVPLLAIGGAMALMTIPYTDLRIDWRSPRESLREDARAVARLIAADQDLHVHGDSIRVLPGGMAYYLDRHLDFLGRKDPEETLAGLPPGAALLIPWRYREDFARWHVDGADSQRLPFEGPLEGYSLLRVINPLARAKDRVLLLQKDT